jgi:hypothetical protein
MSLMALSASRAEAAVWANVKSIDTTVLNNGIQVLLKADGVLDFHVQGVNEWDDPVPTGEITLHIRNAKNATGKTVIKVDKPPVSYIELTMPQGADQGIGLYVRVVFLYRTTAVAKATDDQLGALITVESDTNLQQAGATSQVELSSAQSMRVERDPASGLLSIVAVKANLHRLLSEIGRLTETNILVDDLIDPGPTDGTGGTQITITLAGATTESALQAIAAAAGLGIAPPDRPGGAYMLSTGLPTDLSAYRLADTRSFAIENIDAVTAQGLLPNFLYPYLRQNQDQNAIVVTAPTIMLDKIGRDLDMVDIPPPQIMVEAYAVEFASRSDLERSLGVGYEGMDFMGSMDSATGDLSFQTLTHLPYDFQARVHALETEGAAKVWARPRITVMNGRNAELFIGQTRFMEVEIPSWSGVTRQIQGVRVGVKLNISPWTGGNGEITFHLAPSVSNITEVDSRSGLPQISNREAGTDVRVRDGETIVVGGLTRHEEYVTHRKIPILGELPLIGHLFRSRMRQQLDSELVIFVTPYLLDPVTGQRLTGPADPGLALAESDDAAVAPEAPKTPEPEADESHASPPEPITTRERSRR